MSPAEISVTVEGMEAHKRIAKDGDELLTSPGGTMVEPVEIYVAPTGDKARIRGGNRKLDVDREHKHNSGTFYLIDSRPKTKKETVKADVEITLTD